MSKKENVKWFTPVVKRFMSRGYFNEGKNINTAISDIAEHASEILGKGEDFKDKLESYIRKGYYVIPTPVWKNFNKYSTASPISCFGVYVGDSVESIIIKSAEVALQNKIGGGTSGTFQEVRPRGSAISGGGKSNGSVSMMEIYQSISKVISQPNRRGHFSATLPIEHEDFNEFIGAMRDEHPIQSLSIGTSISDEFMESLLNEDKESVDKIKKLVKAKFETGFPYVFFKDTVNRNKPDIFKVKGKEINHSNMCQEICLPNSVDETFVCCLLGMNLEMVDEWEHTDAVEVGVYFMDSMLQDFLNKMELKRLENEDYYNVLYKPSVKFVENYMALGMGQSGLHSYLQSKSIAFHSFEGMLHSNRVAKLIQDRAIEASIKMAKEYGQAKIFEGTDLKQRHATLTAIAPNTSSSFILNMQSQSIEPYVSNYYVKDVVNVKTEIRNPYLKELLKSKGKDDEEVWLSILKNNGSVQHLDFLTEEEKNVFKTFLEIPQEWIIEMAGARQKWICQSQSLNTMIGKNVDPDEVVYLLLKAWKEGVKTLYYQLNVSQAQEFTKERECVSCAG